MAINKPTGDDARKGAVRKRSQLKNELAGGWTKRSKKKFMDVNKFRRNSKVSAGRQVSRASQAACVCGRIRANPLLTLGVALELAYRVSREFYRSSQSKGQVHDTARLVETTLKRRTGRTRRRSKR